MALLGDDGRGYELARKLESCGVWRTWLGDSTYPNLAPFLSSPSAWESFMRTDPSKSRALIHLQLRVRALLFDKASPISLSSNPNPNPNPSLSRINPNFLRLHPDDIYFTLDNNNNNSSQHPLKTKFGSRYVDSELDNVSQRFELPETWYNQVIEKYHKGNTKLVLGDRDSIKRSPVEMASYIMRMNNIKKRRVVFKEEQQRQVMDQSNGGNLVDGEVDDEVVFPEIIYAWNCVPESALTVMNRVENDNSSQKVRVFSVLDTLPPVMTRSPTMVDRLGVRGQYVNGEHGGGLYRGKLGSEGNGRVVSNEQAVKLSQKVVARILLGVGFESSMEGPIECFAEMMSKHIVKIGTNLKVLADSYKKQCSAIELLKMLLKTMGISNFTPLVDVVKDGSRNIVHQSQQYVHGTQPQMPPQQQSSLRLPQQVQMQRQIHPQMQQFITSHNLAFQQQQLERMRSHQSTPRPAMDVNKERPLVQIKLENPSDLPNDGNTFNSRHPQMQFRQQQQQQLAALSGFHSQSNPQFRQMGSLQIPQIHSPNSIGMVRAPPVKVEGFQELMGGDSTSKHDSEENRLTSPIGK